MSTPVSVLFVAKNSVYKTLGVDCWDEDRNALLWPGGNPIVAHPPCRLFCAMRHLSKAPETEKRLARWAVEKIRNFGGVLEHPARSVLWRELELPVPDWLFDDPWGGFSIETDQFRFGHKAEKKTWVYICGAARNDLPMIPFRQGRPEYTCSHDAGQKKKALTTYHQRSATPLEFARWLIAVAERCKV